MPEFTGMKGARVASGRGGGRCWRVLLLVGALGLLAAPLGWWGTDRLEEDNDFCNACHLEPGLCYQRRSKPPRALTRLNNLATPPMIRS